MTRYQLVEQCGAWCVMDRRTGRQSRVYDRKGAFLVCEWLNQRAAGYGVQS